MSKALATVFRPLTAVTSRVHTAATRNVKVAEGPLATHIQYYRANGESLTTAVFWEFVELQQTLLPSRLNQLKRELSALKQGGVLSVATLDGKQVVYFFRFWVLRLVFALMLGVMVGRGSIHPWIAPHSPFNEQLKFDNPNYKYSH